MSCNPFQPLYIDTNINYSLDMGRFPGLEDPICLREPALLLDTPRARLHWLSASVSESSDIEDVTNNPSRQAFSPSDDLFSLVASCQKSPPCPVQEVSRNDVICDLPSGGKLDFLDEIFTLPSFGEHYYEQEVHYDTKTPKRVYDDKTNDLSCAEEEYFLYCEEFAHLFITELKSVSPIVKERSGKTFEQQISPSQRFVSKIRRES